MTFRRTVAGAWVTAGSAGGRPLFLARAFLTKTWSCAHVVDDREATKILVEIGDLKLFIFDKYLFSFHFFLDFR